MTKEKISLTFLQVDEKEFKEEFLDVTEILSKEELIEKINEIKIDDNIFCKIILTGKRNFEINIYGLYEFILNKNMIKIKDKTELNMNIEEMATEINLRGIFLKEVLEAQEQEKLDKNTADKIIEMGLNILK